MNSSSIIRELEIYNIIGIGNTRTIEIIEWLNNAFSDCSILKDTYKLIYVKDNEQIVLNSPMSKRLYFDYKILCMPFNKKFNLSENEYDCIQIFKYWMCKKYDINLIDYDPVVW